MPSNNLIFIVISILIEAGFVSLAGSYPERPVCRTRNRPVFSKGLSVNNVFRVLTV